MKIEVSQWLMGGNPIIMAANTVSDRLSDLSKLHSKLNKNPKSPEIKKDFIKAAHDIAAAANLVVSGARPIADGCSDKRLKVQISSTIDRVITLVQQLKIIAAVKASSAADTDRDQQLVAW